MKYYNLKVPSLLNQYTRESIYYDNVDLNNMFWRYLFSIDFINKYINKNDLLIKNMIESCVRADKNIIKYFIDYKNIFDLRESHRIFYIIINYYNKVLFSKNNITLSISRNLMFYNENPLVNSIIHDILDKLEFEKNAQFSLKIYFDNEIYLALIIAKYLKHKYTICFLLPIQLDIFQFFNFCHSYTNIF